MDYQLVLQFLLLTTFINAAHIPEVYESGQKNDKVEETFNRPVFNFQEYQKVTQQDPLKRRYMQQQQADKTNIPKMVKQRRERFLNSQDIDQTFAPSQDIPVKTLSQTPWKIIHPKFVTENQKRDFPSEGRTVVNNRKSLQESRPTDNSRITKKNLKPISYLVNEDSDSSESIQHERQDNGNYVFINEGRDPRVLQQSLGGFALGNQHNHIEALNSLLGQNPNAQLHGLQQLLNGNQVYLGGKDHTPIKEDVIDIPNNQAKPNIKVQHTSNAAQVLSNGVVNNPQALKSLQAQLDVTANAHAETILAQAQQKALAHVKAQHEAIARAQAEAEKAALVQIKAHNEALAKAHAEAEADAQRQAQAQAEVEREKAEAEEKEKADEKEKRKLAERKRHQGHARERARLAALAFKIKQEKEKSKIHAEALNQDAHSVAQKTRFHTQEKLKKAHQGREEASETNHHYITHQPVQFHVQQSHVPHAYVPQSHVAQTYVPESHAPEVHIPQIHIPQIHAQHEHESQHALFQPHTQYHQTKVNLKHPQPFTNYGHGQEHSEADVTKYYNPPQITVHEGKNDHGERELQYAANYAFGYRIRDIDHGNDFGHKETKDGDTLKGHYHVLLPDGRVQNVNYYVDPSGYHADVSYGGSADETH